MFPKYQMPNYIYSLGQDNFHDKPTILFLLVMLYPQFRFRLPSKSVRASPGPANESARRGPEPTDESQTSASAADTAPTIRHQSVRSPEIKPEQPPLGPAKASERSETMPPSQSKKESQVHARSPSHSRAKNQSRIASKPPSPLSKAISQSSASSNKSPSSPASSKASPSKDASKPSSPAVAAAAAAPRSRIPSVPPSPSRTSSRNHLNSKPTSEPKPKADSQPSSSSRSPSQANSQKQPSKKTSRVRSSKPTAQPTSLQHTTSSAAIEDQTTNGITPHRANQSSQARPIGRESQSQTKSKQPPKSRPSKNQPQTKEELTSKNTSDPHLNPNSSESPTQSDQTIENGLEPSLESQAGSKEDEENLEKTTNASAKIASISSSESSSPYEPEDTDSQKKEPMGDISKAIPKLNINHSSEENPKSFITLVGDNKGTSMHLLSGKAKRESSIHIRREYKSNPDQSPKSPTDIVEGNFNHKTPKDSRTVEDPRLKLYINNNLQGINNSILCNSSFTERNPGAKLRFFREPAKSEEISQSLHAQKAKYTAKPAERLAYKPTVRRRCLRGLLMESSDSELDDPEKPRRHGCSYSNCKGKDDEIL